ncbi:wings apart-like protein 1 [Arachis duranensis]|uniref:Wings apart-like protein 1 n=1 Tax=Arachis duranensis TaxID=130453 RepID=A0A6P4C4P2_ARADU|nr:wings apart-like protein 1 [Arachis duranensis]
MVLRTNGRRICMRFPAKSSGEGVALCSSSLAFSSQDSNSTNGHFRKRKSKRTRTHNEGLITKKMNLKTTKKKNALKNLTLAMIPAKTSTLIEAQKFGEVMKRIDEVNFAIDGLRSPQPVQIRRTSLLSLLSICATAQQRRLLHAQGIAKTIIDAILCLSLNDLPSNVAAATLFYILTIDGVEDNLLESPDCVLFLIKLLRPLVSTDGADKALKFGPKILVSHKNVGSLENTRERWDSSSVAIFSIVQQILVSCKELKPTCQIGNSIERPELSPEWLALLIIEKACLSSISLYETSGAVCKTGQNFKEKLRELGGLDAVFETTLKCQSHLKCWVEDSYLSTKDVRNDKQLKSLTLLLKCLKIMENATFLSEDNQAHFLGLKRNLIPQATPISFVELILTIIKFLSDVCISRNASTIFNDNKNPISLSTTSHDSELDLLTDLKGSLTLNHTGMCYHMERESSIKRIDLSQKSQLVRCSQLKSSLSVSETPSTSMTYSYSPNMRDNPSKFAPSSGASSSGADCKTCMIQLEISDDNQDPFAFDEDDIAPPKWDLPSIKQRKSHAKKYEVTSREFEEGCLSQASVSNGDVDCSSSYVDDEEGSSLLTDCLLTAIKVLINLTNDNPIGCHQIAEYGGLEIMPLLIAQHFPSFSSSSLPTFHIKENKPNSVKDHRHDRHLTDHEIDFIVAILGLLVNLVEKDGHNRSRLAAASVLLPCSDVLDHEIRKDVIPLLCSIFLANQGGSEDSNEDKYLLLNEEAAILQGEKEARKTIVEAYSALLLAFLSTDSNDIHEAVANNLPDHNLSILVPVLERFVEFHLALKMISPATHKAVSEVIESCKVR